RLTSGGVESVVYNLLTRGSLPPQGRSADFSSAPGSPRHAHPSSRHYARPARPRGGARSSRLDALLRRGEHQAVLGAGDRLLARQRHDRRALQGVVLPAGAEARARGPARLLEHHRRDLGCVERLAPRLRTRLEHAGRRERLRLRLRPAATATATAPPPPDT